MNQKQAREHLGRFVDRATQAWRDRDVDLDGVRAMIEEAAELLAASCGGLTWRVSVATLPASDAMGVRVELGDALLERRVEPWAEPQADDDLVRPGVYTEEIPTFWGGNLFTDREAAAPLRHRSQPAPPPPGAAVVDQVADRLGIAGWRVEEVLLQMGGQDAALSALSRAVAGAQDPEEALVRELVRQVSIRTRGGR